MSTSGAGAGAGAAAIASGWRGPGRWPPRVGTAWCLVSSEDDVFVVTTSPPPPLCGVQAISVRHDRETYARTMYRDDWTSLGPVRAESVRPTPMTIDAWRELGRELGFD